MQFVLTVGIPLIIAIESVMKKNKVESEEIRSTENPATIPIKKQPMILTVNVPKGN